MTHSTICHDILRDLQFDNELGIENFVELCGSLFKLHHINGDEIKINLAQVALIKDKNGFILQNICKNYVTWESYSRNLILFFGKTRKEHKDMLNNFEIDHDNISLSFCLFLNLSMNYEMNEAKEEKIIDSFVQKVKGPVGVQLRIHQDQLTSFKTLILKIKHLERLSKEDEENIVTLWKEDIAIRPTDPILKTKKRRRCKRRSSTKEHL